MQKLAMSLPQPTGSSNGSQSSDNPRHARYSVDRARLLFGQYRKGEANDPETYVATVAAILSQYPMETIRWVTDPITGLATNPVRPEWTGMPDPADVKRACENHHGPQVRAAEREAQARKQIEERIGLPDATTYVPPPGSRLVDWREHKHDHGRPVGRFEKPGDKWNKNIPGDG